MKIFISAGEPSGDEHAAQVVRAVRERVPNLQVTGFGGPELKAAGQDQLFQLTDLAVIGFTAVFPLIRKFWNLYKQADRYLAETKPDAVMLVDFPGFNWWIAKAAKRQGIPVYYYCPPQLWAWAGWRIKKMRRTVDTVFAVLPFEADWYRERGVDVVYVGHPFFDEVAHHQLDEATCKLVKERSAVNVGILPGSRRGEVNKNFPLMLRVIKTLAEKFPHVRFPVACYKQWHLDRCQELYREFGHELPVDFYVGKTPEIIQTIDICFMVSGSVSLEVLARKTPAVVVYRGNLTLKIMGNLLVTCKYMTLANLIAGREIMPEFPCIDLEGKHLTQMDSILSEWLSKPELLKEKTDEVTALANSIVEAGGITKCAETLIEKVESQRRSA